MPNQIFALLLIIVGLLPCSHFKFDLEKKLTNEIIGPKTAENKPVPNLDFTLPFRSDPLSEAKTGSTAAYFVDMRTGEVLYAKNESERLQIASTTKLMTAIIAMEKLDQNKVVTVANTATLPLDSVMGLVAGDKIRVSELMHGLLIESGADAANVLAVEAAGSTEKFVALMNEKAKQFNLADTQFTNPVGHDDEGNYSTAKDLASIARLAISNKTISQIASERTYTATSENGRAYFLSNTNLLLADPNYKGIKTGTTLEAGQCLISLYDDGDRKILGVVLNSPARFDDTNSIVEWTKSVFKWPASNGAEK